MPLWPAGCEQNNRGPFLSGIIHSFEFHTYSYSVNLHIYLPPDEKFIYYIQSDYVIRAKTFLRNSNLEKNIVMKCEIISTNTKALVQTNRGHANRENENTSTETTQSTVKALMGKTTELSVGKCTLVTVNSQ